MASSSNQMVDLGDKKGFFRLLTERGCSIRSKVGTF
jgi:hypothetical protein